jgi:hypothetical protein
LILFVAIAALVVSAPIVAVWGGTKALGRDETSVPDWWHDVTRWSVPVFVVALAFVTWDSFRIARMEERGIVVNDLRVPAPRRRRRRRL